MAKDKDWDELDLEAERPQPPPIPGSVRRGGRGFRLGWLTALLFAAGGAALAGMALEGRAERKAELSRSRDESAELRRNLFVAEDKWQQAEKSRAAEAAKAAQLDEALQMKGAEKDADAQLIGDLKNKLD